MIASIVEGAVRRKQFTLVLFAALAAVGVSSAIAIPRAEDPAVPNPLFGIVVVYPGASPTEIEAQIVDPIEDAIDDLKRVRVRIEDGLMFMRAEFDASSEADAKYDDVLRQLSTVRASLPSGVVKVDVRRSETTEVAVREIALVSDSASLVDLRAITDELEDRLNAVPGVKEVSTWGLPEKQVRIALDLPRLAQLKLPTSQILQAIQADNTSIPGGQVDAGARTMNVETSGRYTSLEEIGER